jgi:hypothetical protein
MLTSLTLLDVSSWSIFFSRGNNLVCQIKRKKKAHLWPVLCVSTYSLWWLYAAFIFWMAITCCMLHVACCGRIVDMDRMWAVRWIAIHLPEDRMPLVRRMLLFSATTRVAVAYAMNRIAALSYKPCDREPTAAIAWVVRDPGVGACANTLQTAIPTSSLPPLHLVVVFLLA